MSDKVTRMTLNGVETWSWSQERWNREDGCIGQLTFSQAEQLEVTKTNKVGRRRSLYSQNLRDSEKDLQWHSRNSLEREARRVRSVIKPSTFKRKDFILSTACGISLQGFIIFRCFICI